MTGYDTPLYPGEIDYVRGRDGCWRAPIVVVNKSNFLADDGTIYVSRVIGGTVLGMIPRYYERRQEPRFEYHVFTARDLAPPLVAQAIRLYNKKAPLDVAIAEWHATRREPMPWTF